ncbi:MAG: chorismate synthase [Phycisphaeraceae bacterium]
MAGNSFGQAFRITTAGESHGPGNVVIIDGVPPGFPLTADDLRPDLERRRPGQSRIVTQRKEPDEPEILSGVFDGRTTGTALAILIRNTDQRSRDYADVQDKFRPGHADYTFEAKYGLRDYRGGGRSSARETAARVAAGAVAKRILASAGVRVLGFVRQIGPLVAQVGNPEKLTLEEVEASIVRCPDPDVAEQMIDLIEQVRREQDSIGGVAEIVATGVPAGWGEPVFDKLKADLGKAMFSLPAVMGVEYGQGFDVATARGSENNDAFLPAAAGEEEDREGEDASAASERSLEAVEEVEAEAPPHTPRGKRITTASNRHGGMLGGISSGQPIILRCAIKPTSSLPREQPTVTREGEPTTIATRGRHDPCLLPRFVPVGEAMAAIVLADHMLRHRAQCGQ